MNKQKQNSSLKYHLENRRLKKKIKLLKQKSLEKKMGFSHITKLSLFIVIISIAVYVYYKSDDMIFLREKVRFFEISRQLRTDVYHQYEAVETILQHLDRMRNAQWQTDMFVLPFLGTSGVSKTYVANIIKQNYYPTYVYEVSKYDLVSNFEQTYYNTLRNLRHCCSVVVLDDLTSNDIDLTARFIAALPRHKVVLFIAIINIQRVDIVDKHLDFSVDENCKQDIVQKFNLAGLNFEIVSFHVLSKFELETAIIQLMIQKHVDYSKCGHLVKEIVENHDIVTQGYKQLHLKLNSIWQCGEDDIPSEEKDI